MERTSLSAILRFAAQKACDMIASAQTLMNGDSTRRLHTLKITAVRCHLLTADFTENALTALTSSIRYWTTALAEIETDEGISGLGESSFWT